MVVSVVAVLVANGVWQRRATILIAQGKMSHISWLATNADGSLDEEQVADGTRRERGGTANDSNNKG